MLRSAKVGSNIQNYTNQTHSAKFYELDPKLFPVHCLVLAYFKVSKLILKVVRPPMDLDSSFVALENARCS